MPDPIYDRANVYEADDGTIHYRASSFGYCIGALVRARMGLTPSTPPGFMLERFAEGRDWEREVLDRGLGVDWIEVTDSRLARFGTVLDSGQIDTRLVWGNKVVTCHPDAIVQHGADKHMRVCEVKFLARQGMLDIADGVEREGMVGLGSAYAWQASIEMLTTGLPMLYVIGVKDVKTTGDTREVVGVSEVLCLEFEEPCYSFRDVKMRVAEVEGWVVRGELPPCVVPFDFPCGYWQEHEARDEREEITDDVLCHLVGSYARNRTRHEATQREYEEIRKDIDGRLAELELSGGLCSGWNISVTDNRPGNVSWKKAYEALAKQTDSKVDLELYRGDEVKGGIRMEKA